MQTNPNVGGKISEDKLEFISKIPEINIHSIVKFMVSEHIIGSFMNNEDRVQDILNGKIMEDCEKSWFIICSDIVEILILQFKSLKGLKKTQIELKSLKEN